MDAARQGDGPSAAVFRNAGRGAVLRAVAASLRISARRGGWRQVDADHPAGRGHRRDEAGFAATANLAEGSRVVAQADSLPRASARLQPALRAGTKVPSLAKKACPTQSKLNLAAGWGNFKAKPIQIGRAHL